VVQKLGLALSHTAPRRALIVSGGAFPSPDGNGTYHAPHFPSARSPPRGLERHRLGRHLLHGAGDERPGGSDVRHVANLNFPETPAKVFDTAKAAALIASDRFRPLTGTVVNSTAGDSNRSGTAADSELLHAHLKRGPLHAQECSGTIETRNDPTAGFQSCQYLLAFGFVENTLQLARTIGP
jgi:hypothetical protein